VNQPTPSQPASPRALTHFLGISQICTWGAFYYSFPLIAVVMQAELGWTKSDLYGALTVGLLFSACLTYPVGLAIDRGYGRHVMTLASLGTAFLMVAWSFVHSLTLFYLVASVLGALQAAILYEPAFAVLARRVGSLNSRKGITHITLWAGFASTIFIPIEQLLIDGWGWRESLWVLAGVYLACAAGFWFYIRPELDVVHTSHSTARAENKARDRGIVKQALLGPTFWLLLIALTIYAAMMSTFTFHMYPMLQEKGISTLEVVQVIAVIGPAQVLGRILISLFASSVSMRALGAILVGLFPIPFAMLMTDSKSVWLLAGIFGAYGLTNGIFTIVRSQVVPEMLSQHAYGALNGLLTIPVTIARAMGPVIAAWLWAIGNNYQTVYEAIVWSSLLLAVTFWAANWASQRYPLKV
jgi:predicted MFS family arabinose efflux permease